MLDAHQLNVFLTAAKTLNFTVAARQLHMTQPSVSQHIQSLEQQFDTELFLRSGRHLRLSDAGAALVPLAQKLVAMSEHIEGKMHALQGEVHGHLMVGCSTTVGKYVLPFLLASFMKDHPRVEASCLVNPRADAIRMLCDGEVQIGVASTRDFCKDVEFHKFMSDPLVLIAPLEHPWARRERIAPEDLLYAQFILREEGSGTRDVMADGLAQFGIAVDQLHTILTLGNSEAIALAVQEGIGVAFVSQMVVSRLVPDRVTVVPVDGLSMQQAIFIGQHIGRPGSTAQIAFWEYVTAARNPVLEMLNARNKDGEWPLFPALSEAVAAEPS